MIRSIFAVAAIAALTFAASAEAEVLHYMANLDGASEVPSHAVPGKGMAMADLDTDTKAFTYKVDYSDLDRPRHGRSLPRTRRTPA